MADPYIAARWGLATPDYVHSMQFTEVFIAIVINVLAIRSKLANVYDFK